MVLFVSGLLFSLLVISELNWVQCEPTKFAKSVNEIFKFAALHSSSIQPYFIADRTVKTADLNAGDAKKIWMFVRHGSRTAKPKEKDVFISMGQTNGLRDQIINNFANKKECALSKDNWDRLKNWQWDSKFNADRELTDTGRAELEKIAKNYKSRFSHLFGIKTTKQNFNVICTNTNRTIESASIFFDKAIGSQGRSNVLVVANEQEEGLIKAYKNKAFNEKNKEIENSGESLVANFYKTAPFKDVIEDVNNRLLFKDTDFGIRRKRVMNIYDLCRYEGIWTDKATSVWCSMFTKSELLVLEYSKDLNSFSENGPSGHYLNSRVCCSSILDMMEHLSSPTGPKVTTYFTHSPAILLHLTAMGAFSKGPKLTEEYTEKGRKDREWNTSTLSPMAANFAAILYSKGKVKFFLNDKVINLPECKKGLCDVNTLIAKFIDQCKK